MPLNPLNRRSLERFALQPMYTGVRIRRTVPGLLEGHAYDLSEGGMRIELDVPLTPHEMIDVEIDLPGETAPVCVRAEVVWSHHDQHDPADQRTALRFDQFVSPGDQFRLLRHLSTSSLRRAA